MEIERKWEVEGDYDFYIFNKRSIKQGYIFIQQGEMRVRSIDDSSFYLTIKSDGNLSREEFEVEIPKWTFDFLWPKTEGRRIEKTRGEVIIEGSNFEIDIFQDRNLVILEKEFETEEEANKLTLGFEDVTSNPKYKNKNLAK